MLAWAILIAKEPNQPCVNLKIDRTILIADLHLGKLDSYHYRLQN